MLSFVVSGLACIFAALCYAEFASMAPVAGSAYTYSYSTLGELFAWIIGWDLVLEYAVASSTVAHGWSHYFQDFINILGTKVFGMENGLHLPHNLHQCAVRLRHRDGSFRGHGDDTGSARSVHHHRHHDSPHPGLSLIHISEPTRQAE